MKNYKGVITDPRDGEVVYEVKIEAESSDHRPSESSVVSDYDLVDTGAPDVLDPFSVTPDTNPEFSAPELPSETLEDEVQPPVPGKYDLLRDRLISGVRPTAARLSSKYADLRPKLAQKASQLGSAIAIAAEGYEGGKPKPKPKPRPRPVHPRMAEFNDKYSRIRSVFRGQQAQTPRSQGRRRPADAGMKKGQMRAPRIRISNR